MSKPKLGDIIEIRTSKGLAYAQYTHKHPQYGGLIRVFDQLFSSRPSKFDKLVHGSVRFSTFIPVTAATKRGIFKIVAHEEIAHVNRTFPTFRTGVPDAETNKVAAWWFWDGEKEWRVGEISPEERKMPLRGVWNDTLLIKRLESGWTPADDAR